MHDMKQVLHWGPTNTRCPVQTLITKVTWHFCVIESVGVLSCSQQLSIWAHPWGRTLQFWSLQPVSQRSNIILYSHPYWTGLCGGNTLRLVSVSCLVWILAGSCISLMKSFVVFISPLIDLRWATHFVSVWRKILFVSLVGNKHCFVLLYICNFLNSVTILCAFWVNYSSPQIRKMCAPN